MKCLDLYCAAGGAGMGYSRAGFVVTGVDLNPQPHYPFEFEQRDALTIDPMWIAANFDFVHASPPCQEHTKKTATWGRQRTHWIEHLDLIPQTRALLEATGLPYIIENVVGAPVRPDVTLCGTQFGLRIIKHRVFEANFPLFGLRPPCDHSDVYNPWQGKGRSAKEFREAQGTPWIPMAGGASRKQGITGDLYNAIPPAFTEWLGRQAISHIIASRQEKAA